jgi:hypothetical protein
MNQHVSGSVPSVELWVVTEDSGSQPNQLAGGQLQSACTLGNMSGGSKSVRGG